MLHERPAYLAVSHSGLHLDLSCAFTCLYFQRRVEPPPLTSISLSLCCQWLQLLTVLHLHCQSSLFFLSFCIFTPWVIWEMVVLLSFLFFLHSFISGKFVSRGQLCPDSAEHSLQSHQVSMWVEEMAFVLGQSPFTEECSFCQGFLVWNWKLYCVLLWYVSVSVCPLLGIQVIVDL